MNPEDLLRELKDPDRWKNVRVPRAAGRGKLLTRVPPARLAQLVAAYTIAILFAVGLLVGLQSVRHAPPPAATPTRTQTQTSPPPVSAPIFTVVPGATHVYGASNLPPGCTLAQLQTESKQDGGGAAGTYIQSVAVRNIGADCVLALDAVRVGGEIVSQASGTGLPGLVIPDRASAQLVIATAEACQPSDTANIDPNKSVLPIALRVGDATRTMTARFPKSRCSQPNTHGYVDSSMSDRFASPLPRLEANVEPPASTPVGPLRYTVVLQNAGPKALVLTSCPSATEVLNGFDGRTVSRTLTLRCTIGATLEPDVPVTISVPTMIPTKGYWTISWFLGGGSATAAASTTCTLSQLVASEPGPGGGAVGNWVQLVEVRNRGAACVLPVTAFALSGSVARAGQAKDAGGFHLAAASTTELAVAAATTCADGTMNIRGSNGSLPGPDAKPIVLQLGGHDASGLDQPFPRLYCSGLYVDLNQ